MYVSMYIIEYHYKLSKDVFVSRFSSTLKLNIIKIDDVFFVFILLHHIEFLDI